MDFDRADYLARDALNTGLKSVFEINRCILGSKIVMDDEGANRLAFRKSMLDNIKASQLFSNFGLPTIIKIIFLSDQLNRGFAQPNRTFAIAIL